MNSMDKTQNNLEEIKNKIRKDFGRIIMFGEDDTADKELFYWLELDDLVAHIAFNYTPNSQIKQSNEEITFDATGAYWEGEENGWLLVAIQNGRVIWDEKHLAKDISNVVYRETGNYMGAVIRQKDIEVASKYYLEQYKSKESED